MQFVGNSRRIVKVFHHFVRLALKELSVHVYSKKSFGLQKAISSKFTETTFTVLPFMVVLLGDVILKLHWF